MAKILHTFKIKRSAEIEEEKTETVKNDNGEETTRRYKETVTKEIPVEIQINQAWELLNAVTKFEKPFNLK